MCVDYAGVTSTELEKTKRDGLMRFLFFLEDGRARASTGLVTDEYIAPISAQASRESEMCNLFVISALEETRRDLFEALIRV